MWCPKRLFVIEFITGGGLTGEPLPGSLAHEGELMLAALLGELGALPGIDVTTTRDHRLSPLSGLARCVTISASDDPFAVWRRCIEDADAVWPIAPETGGVLESLSRLVLEQGRQLIGSSPEGIAVTASKYRCAEFLGQAGLPVVPTQALREGFPKSDSGWVVKPDDGAGCSETRIFADSAAARASIEEREPGHYVMQPYIHGAHCSISMVCADNHVLMMSVNEQRIAVFDNQLHYMGSTVNGVRDQHRQCWALAEQVLSALPGLWGYVGIDFIMGADGPVVLEVNPRVTISHAGLRQSTSHNPARLLLELLQEGRCAPLETRRIKPVSIDITPFPHTGGHR